MKFQQVVSSLLLPILLSPSLHAQDLLHEVDLDDTKVFCPDIPSSNSMENCLCSTTATNTLILNCDHVVFQQDIPNFHYSFHTHQTTHFSWRGVHLQNIPPQAFTPATPLLSLDLSRKNLRRLSERALEGLGETLEVLDLSENALGDALNPIFSSQEFGRLPRLKRLSLRRNGLRKLDIGLLQGMLSLQEVNFEGNELNEVPAQALNGPKVIKSVNLAHNLIQELGRNDFAGLKSLLQLNLTGNILTSIESGAFLPLSNLKILTLALNHLQRINSDAFNGLASLEELSLSDNFLRQIPRAAFEGFTGLRRLRLNANLLRNVSREDLHPLRFTLAELHVSRNRLSIIPDDTFSELHFLHTLDISVNQLRTIPKTLFDGLVELTSLDLSDNNLLFFPVDALTPIRTTLRSLYLSFNRISAIQGIPTTNLRQLSLGNNLLRHIPPFTLQNLTQLEYLYINGNQLESIDDLRLSATLLSLYVQKNNISVLPRLALPLLQILDASYNSIHNLLPHNFILLSQLRELHLEGNGIKSISENAFQGLPLLLLLDLSFNHLQSTEPILGLPSLRSLNLSTNDIIIPKTLQGLPLLQSLDLSSNEITLLQEPILPTPSPLRYLSLGQNKLSSFRGLYGNFSSLTTLSLSSNNITYVFPHAFQGLTQLEFLDFSENELTFFPSEALQEANTIAIFNLSRNRLRNIGEISFANFPRLRRLELSHNGIETLPDEPFRNSSQLQYIDLSYNKIEEIQDNFLNGIVSLNINLANNFLSFLPPNLFSRNHLQRLNSIDISNNAFSHIPTTALQPQLFFLETLDISSNRIRDIPLNNNVLVNVKHLNISHNPLSPEAQMTLLNEPKTTRTLYMANTNTTTLPLVEIPFLKTLDLSTNRITDIPNDTFKRTTLLKTLLLQGNPLTQPPGNTPLTLRHLDLSHTAIRTLSGKVFSPSLFSLRLNELHLLSRLEKATLNLPLLQEISITDLPQLAYVDVRGILNSLRFLEKIDFEVKDSQILDQLHSALSPRLAFIGLHGKAITSISTGALVGLSSPTIQIQLTNTSLSTLPPILVPVPASSTVFLDLADSKIITISPPLLSQNIRITGINPHCDCHAIQLINYLKKMESKSTCSSPALLRGMPLTEIKTDQLLCSNPSLHQITLTTSPPPLITTTTADDIIWSLPSESTTHKHPRKAETTTAPKKVPPTHIPTLDTDAMDNLILGIVGGVILLLVLFILSLLCCLRKTNQNADPPTSHLHVQPNCTCPPKTPFHQHHHHHSHFPHSQGHLQPLQPIPAQQIYASLPYYIDYENRR